MCHRAEPRAVVCTVVCGSADSGGARDFERPCVQNERKHTYRRQKRRCLAELSTLFAPSQPRQHGVQQSAIYKRYSILTITTSSNITHRNGRATTTSWIAALLLRARSHMNGVHVLLWLAEKERKCKKQISEGRTPNSFVGVYKTKRTF